MIGLGGICQAQEKILNQFEAAGIWKVDRPNHRCLIDRGVWDRLPFEKKEQTLQVIYVEEKTWWKINDRMSGKLLGEVSSWGWKIYP
jgi:hypothetical protein